MCALLLGAGLVLAGCQSVGTGVLEGAASGRAREPAQPRPQSQPRPRPELSASVSGERIGDGPWRVALLLPRGAGGAPGEVAEAMVRAARLGVRDFGATRLQIVVKDIGDGAATAEAVREAKAEGASLILGPLLARNAGVAGAAAAQADLPIVTFTSDVARAARGRYILAYTPDADIRRTLAYGRRRGARNLVAFLPDDAFGRLAEAAMRDALEGGVSLRRTVRYARTPQAIADAARAAADAVSQADALYIPDGGAVPTEVLGALRAAGVTVDGKLILGSGQWETARLSDPLLRGAVFAGADKSDFARFADRYRATYARQPPTIAVNAYDAVAMAAALVGAAPDDPFTVAAIERSDGFAGAGGAFRFGSDGVGDRALSVYRVENGRAALVAPAPRGF